MRIRGIRFPRRHSRLRPRNWPVRWRLAGASAGLTLAILLIFGILIGQLVSDRIRDDFDREIQSGAQALAGELQIVYTPVGTVVGPGPRLDAFVFADNASARVFDIYGKELSKSTGAAALGPLRGGTDDFGSMRVATIRLTSSSGALTGYLQYGRSLAQVDSTISRLWLLILGGVLGGGLLASLAGIAIANRAMRPISSLTATARQVADTRDPSRQMPAPKADDEVGELARTLEQMLRSLDAARAEREAAMQQQREFVADASHELRTPLTSILANLELLQASLQGPGQGDDRAMADSALRSSRRMSRLVADLLLLARADAGRPGERRRCDLSEIAAEAAAEVAPTMEGRGLHLDSGPPLWIDGNPDELHRMVLNLLDNAAHHTPANATIELRLRSEGGSAVIEVADDGPGIPPQLRDSVFERFVRGEGPADTAAGPGTGLGLAIVRAVALSHGGTAEATESESGGALLRIRLPLGSPEQRAKAALDRF